MAGFRRNKEAISRRWPRRTRWHAPPAVAGAISLTIANVAQAQATTTTLNLVQVHVLTMQNVAQAQASITVTLTLPGAGPTRVFDGAADNVTLAIGSLADLRDGNLTIAALIKKNASKDQGLVEFHDGTGIRCGLILASDNSIGMQDNIAGATTTLLATANWNLVVITRSGSTIEAHRYDYGTGLWTHNVTATVTAVNDTLTQVRLGGPGFGDFNGKMSLAAAQAGTAFSDVQIETLAAGLQGWVNLFTAGAVWRLDQASTGTAVPDIIGSADQTALSGTTVDAADGPSPFDWSLAANLIVQNVAQGQGTGNVPLTVQTALVVANVAQGQGASTVDIEPVLPPAALKGALLGTSGAQPGTYMLGVPPETLPTLGMNDVAQAQGIGNVVLVVPSTTLAVQSVAQGQTTTTVTISLNLVIASIAQAQGLGNIIISKNLVVQSVAQAQATGNVPLTIPLLVQNVTQGQTTSLVPLQVPLLVQSLAQGQASTSPTLLVTWGTPQNLTATAISDDQIDLDWDVVLDATGYDIERDSVVIVQDHVPSSYSDTGLDPSTLYTYRVRGVKV